MRGRPQTPNKILALNGSRHAREGINLPANPLKDPDIPPEVLNAGAKQQWLNFVPQLVKESLVREPDRLMLCVLCDSLAIYFATDDEGRRNDPKECRLAAENILLISREFNLTPLSRSKSGIQDAHTSVVDSRHRE